jgi:hypothetical protein
MTHINNPIATRNTGPNHEGKFSRAFKKFSPVIVEIRRFNARNKRTEPLSGSDFLADVIFAIWYTLI